MKHRLQVTAFALGRPMDEGTWSTVLGALQESTIPRWSLCCNRYCKLLNSASFSKFYVSHKENGRKHWHLRDRIHQALSRREKGRRPERGALHAQKITGIVLYAELYFGNSADLEF
jgi:hypothetical protein